jgi:hypothetical protein
MSIVSVVTLEQRGKMGKVGVNNLSELESSTTVYAHSAEEAIAWAKSYPLYENAEIEHLSDGRIVITSPWIESKSPFFSVLEGYEDVTHTRSQIWIYSVNTVFVHVGFQPKR